MRSLIGHIVVGLGYGFVFLGSNVQAQSNSTAAETGGKLEEIIVTAERRTSDVQKIATSVSVRSGDDMAEQGRYSLSEILRDVPNVSAPEPDLGPAGGSDSQGGGITIRGTDGGGLASPVSKASTTAVYVDGIYEGIGSDYDIERVEVLRGPQGTLYGRSATSGVVGSYTRNPTFDTLNGNATAQLGNYTQQLYTAAVNVPFSDTFAIRIAGNERKQEKGYYNGAGGGFDRTHGRIKMLYQPLDNLSVLLGVAFEENDQNTGGCTGTSPADGTVVYTTCTPVGTTHNHGRQYWLNIDWDMGPMTLVYQPALRTYNQKAVSDLLGPYQHPMTQTILTPHDQFVTQELRLASNNTSKLAWQAGLFYYHNAIHTEEFNKWTDSGASLYGSFTSRDTKDYGIFGEATYGFTDAIRLTLGARYDYTRVNTSQVYSANLNFQCNVAPPTQQPTTCGGSTLAGLPENSPTQAVNENTTPSGLREWRKFNYKVRYEQDLTSTNLMYAVVSTGFIPGDVQVASGGGGLDVRTYDAEVLTAYEVGSKNRFFDEKLQVNGDVFYYQYQGFQELVQVDPQNPLVSHVVTVPARMRGTELELLYQFTSHDRVGLNYAYLESWYVDKPADFARDVPWKHRVVTPHTVTANYEHIFDLRNGSQLSARIDGTFESAHRIDNYAPSSVLGQAIANDPSNSRYVYRDSETTGNINVNWRSSGGKYSVGMYVRNFTDRVRIDYSVIALNPRSVSASQTDPRTYGMMLSARF